MSVLISPSGGWVNIMIIGNAAHLFISSNLSVAVSVSVSVGTKSERVSALWQSNKYL